MLQKSKIGKFAVGSQKATSARCSDMFHHSYFFIEFFKNLKKKIKPLKYSILNKLGAVLMK